MGPRRDWHSAWAAAVHTRTCRLELSFDAHLVSDLGHGRARNEDRCGAFVPEEPATRAERGRLFIVADGMGGHAAGDVAAELTLQTIPATYYNAPWAGANDTLRAAFATAYSVIERDERRDRARTGMGAAAVAAALIAGRLVVAHVGDCRAYRLRGTHIERLTVDHSAMQERIAAGLLSAEETQADVAPNYLTRALSRDAFAAPDVGEWTVERGDTILLCSDGLWNVVTDAQIAQVLNAAPDAVHGARALVDCALKAGGRDNITAIVVLASVTHEN